MTAWLDDGDVRLYHGDALEQLALMPSESVQCIVTSPPFWGLRDYGTGSWEGGADDCDHLRVAGFSSKSTLADTGHSSSPEARARVSEARKVEYGSECGKCGARRVDQQIGLEETPDAWCTRLVAVMREARRVLRSDGLCWLECGDSYMANGSGGMQGSTLSKGGRQTDYSRGASRPRELGEIKHKDLVGAPWLLARALRDPYYTGSIKRDADRIWLAAIVDGEGCIHIHRRPAGTSNYAKYERKDGTTANYERKNDSFQMKIEISNTNRLIMDRVVELAGGNCENKQEAGTHGRKQTIYRWTLTSDKAKAFLREVYPYLIGKQHEARLALGCPSSGQDATAAWEALKQLHAGSETTVDFPAPPSLYEAGWFLRSDCIWARLPPNPMPESVTDRPTKEHSYVFLLTKSARYFYDADAIRETSIRAGERAGGDPMRGQEDNGHVKPSWGHGEVPAARNARSVWSIATEPTPFAHFACVDDQTEALTPNGWRRHDQLKDGDTIAAYDLGVIDWEPATFHRYEYDGDLVAIEKRDSSQRLTPNHRCLVRSRSGKQSVVRADELGAKHEVPTAAFMWRGAGEGIGLIVELVGWYIAEGWRRSPHTIGISQSLTANPLHVQNVDHLLDLLGADFTRRVREREWRGRPAVEVEWTIRGDVAKRVLEVVPDKRMTPQLANLPIIEGETLLRTLVHADGHIRADGRRCIIQKDADSIGLMQMLAVRLGYRAIVTKRAEGSHALYLTHGDWLTLRGTNGVHAPISREHYAGPVWCPNVPSGFWMARRNGRPFITGNTFPQALVERCIKAGTSEHGACSECGAPWRRITTVEQVPDKSGGSVGNGHFSSNPSDTGKVRGYGETRTRREVSTLGWEPSCAHDAPVTPCLVADPFMGSGTTALVARRLNRHALGIELNAEYLAIAAQRLQQPTLWSDLAPRA